MPEPDFSQSTVLDLPQLYTHPPATSLLPLLHSFAISPPSWDTSPTSPQSRISEAGLPAYLTSLIACQLRWITSDEEKEAIWEAASARLSERSGRTAMSSISRTFSIPTMTHTEGKASTVEITLHEPGLTGDSIGHKTWLASYLLAKRLHLALPTHLPTLLHHHPQLANQSGPLPPLRILELGSGTGLTGLAASALLSTFPNIQLLTHLSDLEDIVPNLNRNIRDNTHLSPPPTSITAEILDWETLPPSHQHPIVEDEKYDIILAADSLYSPSHPGWLANAIAVFLLREAGARVFIELPVREAEKADLHGMLRGCMREKGLGVLEEGREVGYDDWEGGNGEGRVEVECWWSVWGWEDVGGGNGRYGRWG